MKDKIIDIGDVYQNAIEEMNEKIKDLTKEEKDDNLFKSIVSEKDINKRIELANEAYESNNYFYEYKMYAISLYKSKKKRLEEYKVLLNFVCDMIKLSDEDSLAIFNKTEINAQRFIDLNFKYIMSLLENGKYKIVLDTIDTFEKMYKVYASKTKVLKFHALNMLGRFSDVIAMYNEESDENCALLMPLSYAYFKNHNIKNFTLTVERLFSINPFVQDLLLEYIEGYNKLSFEDASYVYYVRTKEEAKYCLKYASSLYLKDEAFIGAIRVLLTNI